MSQSSDTNLSHSLSIVVAFHKLLKATRQKAEVFLLDDHQGEWFDPPENFMYYPSYKAIQFNTIFFGVLPVVYLTDEEEGLRYYGRIIFSESKNDCPDVVKWTPIENKVWLRTNDLDYYGPFDNCSQAAIEIYRQFFKNEFGEIISHSYNSGTLRGTHETADTRIGQNICSDAKGSRERVVARPTTDCSEARAERTGRKETS